MRFVLLMFVVAVLMTKPTLAAHFEGAMPRIHGLVDELKAIDFQGLEKQRKARTHAVTLASVIRHALLQATEADQDKVAAPLTILARPGEKAGEDIVNQKPGAKRLALEQVPQIWANTRLDLARDRVNEMLTFLDSGAMTEADYETSIRDIANILDSLYFPPAP